MAVIRQPSTEAVARHAVALQLDDVARRAREFQEAAQRQALEVLASANAERDRLLSSARTDGHRQGHAQGFAKGIEEGRAAGKAQAAAEQGQQLHALADALASALAALDAQRSEVIGRQQADVLMLATEVATRLSRLTFQGRPERVEQLLHDALQRIVRPTSIVVRLHPTTLDALRDIAPKAVESQSLVTSASLLADPGLQQSDCIVELTGGGRIDASLSTQLDEIVAAILQDEGIPSNAPHGAAP